MDFRHEAGMIGWEATGLYTDITHVNAAAIHRENRETKARFHGESERKQRKKRDKASDGESEENGKYWANGKS